MSGARHTTPLAALASVLLLGACDGEVSSGAPDDGAAVGRDGGMSAPSDGSLGGGDGGIALDGGVTSEVDAGPLPDGVPMFVAIGKLGRITTSCDDGRTWAFDRSDDDTASCVGIDCDHHPGSATGLTWGDGTFWASFGWGDNPTRLFRSDDGVTWEVVYDMRGFSFAGIAWAGDRLVAGDVTPRWSIDRGMTFEAAAWPDYDVPDGAWPNSRWIGYAPYDGGRIALVAAAGDGSFSDTVVSRDQGATYVHPSSFPDACTGHGPRLTYGNGVWLETWSTTAAVCRSDDGGESFEMVDLGTTGDTGGAIFTGSEFVLYVGDRGYRSTDGRAFTPFDLSGLPSGAQLGAVAHDPRSGTFVAVDGGWGRWYADQRLYRSADGVSWEVLSDTDFVHGHPITHMTFGYGRSSAMCP